MSIFIEGIDAHRFATYLNSHGHSILIDTPKYTGKKRVVEIESPYGRLGDLDYAIELLKEYAEEYSEVDENGLHSDKWCGYMECIEALKEIPAIVESD